MVRFTAIGLFLIYLVSFTEFKEALRLPLLVEHYAEHKVKAGELSFFEFLVMHYETDVAHDDRDNRLPFKDCSHSFIGQVVMLPMQKISLTERVESNANTYQFFYLQHEPKLIAIDIFQPPNSNLTVLYSTAPCLSGLWYNSFYPYSVAKCKSLSIPSTLILSNDAK